MRQPAVAPKPGRVAKLGKGTSAQRSRANSPPLPLDEAGLARFEALKAWRAELARKHKLPAYVIFHDATLAEMAHAAPDSLEAIENISGVGVKKLETYGRDILRVLGS